MTGARKGWKFLCLNAAGLSIIVMIAIAFYWFGVRPVVNVQENLAAQQREIAQQHERLEQTRAKADLQKQELAQVRKALTDNPIRLAPAEQVNAQIGRLAELASSVGLKTDEMQPAEPTYCPYYGSVPIHLAGSGNYPAWTAFAHQLARKFPDVSIIAFQLAGKPEDAGAMQFGVELVWYVTPQPALAQK